MLKGMNLAICDSAHCPPEWFRLRPAAFRLPTEETSDECCGVCPRTPWVEAY